MDKRLLLTYVTVDNYNSFKWFKNIKELDRFISEDKNIGETLECIDCKNAVKIDLDLLGD